MMQSTEDPLDFLFNITAPREYSVVGLAGVAFEVILMFLICFGNGLVFAAFIRNESLRTLTNYYILQLAIADFAVGLLMPVHIAMYLFPEMLKNVDLCMFRYTSMLWLMGASIMSLVAMTWDRFSAVTQPLRYQEKLTKRQYFISVLSVWSLPTLLGLVMPSAWHKDFEDLPPDEKECDYMYMMHPEAVGYIQLPLFAIITVTIIGLYAKIFHVASKHAAAMAERDQISTQQNAKEKKRMRKDMKMVKTGMIILGSFYICWTPFMSLCGVQVYGDLIYNESVKNMRSMALFPAVFNSALNPIIYPFRMGQFKIEFMRILRIKQKNRVTDFDSSSYSENERVRNTHNGMTAVDTSI